MTEMTKQLYDLIGDDISTMLKTIEKKHGVILKRFEVIDGKKKIAFSKEGEPDKISILNI